jgi:DNA-binding NtrC family response regulator
MAYSVLILDDDADFNSLLTDVFEQADYIVTSLVDPVEAIEVFTRVDYDLVVTDQKMPELTGAQFMATVKKIKPEVPVIMVSGFLENDTIRELISDGVGGVFLKPLNIFSLLERTAALIHESHRLKESGSAVKGDEASGNVDARSDFDFSFRSFPCQAQTSIEFAERLYNLRNFKSTLSLIGDSGTHFRMICEDIRGFYESDKEHFIYLTPSSFDAAHVLERFEQASILGVERVTCVLLDVELMSDSQKGLAVSLSKCSDVFEAIELPSRTIFCVTGNLDTLFDEEAIDENLYILMGTAEVCVPRLNDCPEDIAIMAQQIVVDLMNEPGGAIDTYPRFEPSARGFLCKHTWDHNYEQLRNTVQVILDSQTGDVLTLDSVTSALQSNLDTFSHDKFGEQLALARIDYVRASSILLNGDHEQVAAFWGTDTSAIEATLK